MFARPSNCPADLVTATAALLLPSLPSSAPRDESSARGLWVAAVPEARSTPAPNFHGNPLAVPVFCLTRRRPSSSASPLPVADLVTRLAQMPIELAAPLLRSQMSGLTEPVLISIIVATGAAHHTVIAARPGLSPRVVEALIETGDSAVLATLAAHGHPLRPGLRSATAETSVARLRFVAAVRAADPELIVAQAATETGIDRGALRRLMAEPSVLVHALIFRACGLDRAVFTHCLDDWVRAWQHDYDRTLALRPMVLGLFDLPVDLACTRLSQMATHAR